MADMKADDWQRITLARCYANIATETLLLKNKVPRSRASAISEAMSNEDAQVRGNRSKDSIPTWDDARYCFAATLRTCLAMLESPYSPKEPQE